MPHRHDVVIIGAGPGGSAAAHFLAQAGLDVLLLDKSDFPRDKTCGDGLTPRAVHMLDEIGVRDELMSESCHMKEATVFGPAGVPITTQIPERPDLPGFMMVVPRRILDDRLRQQAISSGAHFHSRVHVTGLEQNDAGVVVHGTHGGGAYTACARTGIIAIGASVRLLKTLGILKETPPMILAARGYYEGLQGVGDRFEFHFDGIPLPGYGWIFPLSDSSANIGAGVMPRRSGKRRPAKKILADFLKQPAFGSTLAGARQVGPIKGYPIRTDFATAPTHDRRLLLVGEAAGLVNPLTGEGIDYALESGAMAAQHLIDSFTLGDLSPARLAEYDSHLRAKFRRLFRFSGMIRDYYLHKPILNRLVYVANKRPHLRQLFTDIVLGNEDAAKAVSLQTVAQVLFTL